MSIENKILPKGWRYKKLGEMFNFIGGGTPSKNELDYWNGNINWASVKDIKGEFLNSTKDFITDNGLKNSASNIAEKGDVILITRIIPGRSIITNIRTAINQDLKIVKPKFQTTSKFIYYFFSSIENNFIDKSSGTTVLGITLNVLNELEIPDLSIQEQHLIVSKIEELFSELDKGIENLKLAQQQLKTYRQSVLKWAFEGTKKTSVGQLFDFIGGGTPSKQVPIFWKGNIPWASVKDVKGDYLNDTIDRISEEGLLNSASNIANTGEIILITRISPGKAIITNIRTAINQDLKVVKPKFKTTSKYIFYVFKSIERECIKQSNGTTVLGINLTSLKEIEVPDLAFSEQHFIVQEIESRLSVADKMEESITQSLLQAEALRQSILKKAFEGKLV